MEPFHAWFSCEPNFILMICLYSRSYMGNYQVIDGVMLSEHEEVDA